jgi:hypothetical protein
MSHADFGTTGEFVSPATLVSGFVAIPVTICFTIELKYIEAQSFLGAPTAAEADAPNGGRFRTYANGAIYWTPSTCAHVIFDPIKSKWDQLGGPEGALGYPTSDVQNSGAQTAVNSSYWSTFERGFVFSYPGAQTNGVTRRTVEVHGPIWQKWVALGGSSGFLGLPVADVQQVAGGRGEHCLFRGGEVFYSAQTGAHEVHGAIRQLYGTEGGPDGRLGFPVSDEQAIPNSLALGDRMSTFQGGVITWSPTWGAHVVSGPILVNWLLPANSLFAAKDDEADAPRGGRFQEFDDGIVYWRPDYGAHAIRISSFLTKWQSIGGINGRMGYPLSEEYAIPQYWRQDYEGGFITTTDFNTFVVHCRTPGVGCDEVIGQPPPLPDLAVITTWAEPDFPPAGTPFTVKCAYANRGTVAATPFTVRMELDGGVNAVNIQEAQSLQPGQGDTAFWNLPGLPQGDHYVYAYVDSQSQVPDANRNNNLGYVGITVF